MKEWTEEKKTQLRAVLQPYIRPGNPAAAMQYAAEVMEKHGWDKCAHDSPERLAWAALRIELKAKP